MEPEEIFVSVSFILHFPLQKHKKKSITVSMWLEQSLQSSVKNAEGCVGH